MISEADVQNIEQWVELYTDQLYSWAFYKTSDRETSEDLVQDTFLAAYKNLAGFKEQSNPRTWLFGILNNKISDYYRKKLRYQSTAEKKLDDQITGDIFSLFFDKNDKWEDLQKPADWPEEKENLLDDPEFNKVLQNCITKLPAQWASALELKYIQEKKGDDVCQELGITPTNYWQILHRAKLQLRKCLELNWFQP